MDGTHGTTAYGYYLINLVVKDQTGMGCPVAHLITNKDNEATNTVLLQVIKEKIGHPITVEYVMTDMARAYHNAWCNVMHDKTDPSIKVPVAVKCLWHVIKAWKERTSSIKEEHSIWVEENLRALIHSKDKENIKLLLNQFILECETQ